MGDTHTSLPVVPSSVQIEVQPRLWLLHGDEVAVSCTCDVVVASPATMQHGVTADVHCCVTLR